MASGVKIGGGTSVGIVVGGEYSTVAIGVKVESVCVEVAVGKGIMVGAGMNSGVQAARVRASKTIQSHPLGVEFGFTDDLDMQVVFLLVSLCWILKRPTGVFIKLYP
jgi:hypothetical protein